MLAAIVILTFLSTFTQAKVILPKAKQFVVPNATLFDNDASNGPSVTIQLGEPSLASRNFDNMASSVKGFGLWCFYEDEAYNIQNPESGYLCAGIDEFGLIMDTPLDNKISSARFIGNPTSVGTEGINIFTNRNFAGLTYQNAVTDMPSMPATGGSVIINGCSPWSVFTEENYGGECACLINFSQVVPCFPLLLADQDALGPVAGQIKSVRKGCQCV